MATEAVLLITMKIMTSITDEARILRDRRTLWLESLNGRDYNSITNQIGRMVWNAAAFRIINESRRIASSAGGGPSNLNELLHEFMNEGFLAFQLSAVRRLCDVYSLEGKRGVNSVRGLVGDIRDHAHLLTRKNILAAEALIYDSAEVERRVEDYARNHAGTFALPPDLDDLRVRQRHEQIDRLTATTSQGRRENDQIPTGVFDVLLIRIDDASREMHLYVDKYLAHAATAESRALKNAGDLSITLGHIYDAHRAICETVSFISTVIFGDSTISLLASPQYNIFEYIDRALVAPDQIPRLRHVWDDFKEETIGWENWGLVEFEAERERRNAGRPDV